MVRTGGHAWTQAALLQFEVEPESARKRYTVLPFESKRTRPSRVLATARVVLVGWALGLAVGDAATGATLGEVLGDRLGDRLGEDAYGVPAPQAVASNAAAARPPVRTIFERMVVTSLKPTC